MYFGAPDIIGEAESKLENLVIKPNQRIAKYLVEFNRLDSITGWDNHALRHQFYHGLPGVASWETRHTSGASYISSTN
jgi:hypothetical protein